MEDPSTQQEEVGSSEVVFLYLVKSLTQFFFSVSMSVIQYHAESVRR